MPIIIRRFLAVLALVVPLAACSSQGANLPVVEPSKTDDTNYRLGPGDKVHVAVVGAEDLTGDYAVGDNGTIGLALIGDVKAAGLTRAQLERDLEKKLAEGYLKNPRVSVSILNYRPFYILGEVKTPGTYPYASGMRVTSAIATAGGYTYRANENYVVISRHGVDRKALPDTAIEPDDVIRVPERFF
jgi:protein involved in polysaccharide export with SLBB domain